MRTAPGRRVSGGVSGRRGTWLGRGRGARGRVGGAGAGGWRGACGMAGRHGAAARGVAPAAGDCVVQPEVGRRAAASLARRAIGSGGFPFGDHGFEPAGQFLQLAHGRAASRREHGVLGRVFGEGGDQQGDDRGDRLTQGRGRGGMHG